MRRVSKFAQLISSDVGNAEDLAQDALERAIRGLKTFNPAEGEVEGWLWRIVVTAGRDAGRIAGRQRLVFELLADRWSPEEKVVDGGDQSRRMKSSKQFGLYLAGIARSSLCAMALILASAGWPSTRNLRSGRPDGDQTGAHQPPVRSTGCGFSTWVVAAW